MPRAASAADWGVTVSSGAPGMTPWATAVTEAAQGAPLDLDAAAAWELPQLWHDLADARGQVPPGSWSIRCDDLTMRIVVLSRLAGPTASDEVPLNLVLDGTYQGILTAATVSHDPPDMDRIREIETRGSPRCSGSTPAPGK